MYITIVLAIKIVYTSFKDFILYEIFKCSKNKGSKPFGTSMTGIKKEAKPERTRGLIDFRMLADARRDKTPVIAR